MLAQKCNGFYFEPLVSKKIHTNLKNKHQPALNTPYFNIKASQFIATGGILVGLNFGYTLKNSDKIQFGVSQDESSQGYEIYGTEVSTVSTFTSTIFKGNITKYGYGGIAATNFSLMYKRLVLDINSTWFRKNRSIKAYLNMGISYYYKPDNGEEQLVGGKGISYISHDSSLVTIEINQFNAPMPFKRSFKINVGLDFTFCKKEKEMFSLNVSFITNRKQKAFFSYTNIHAVVEKNNIKERYFYYIQGTGNGIYFTLSKRIYPIKYYNDRQQRKIEEFKNKQK